jgi:hypothetical protein
MNEPADFSALIEAIKLLHEPRLLNMPKLAHGDDDAQRQLLVIPKGMETVDLKPILDGYRDRPARRKGTSTFGNITSFIEWVGRNSTADASVIFANPSDDAPSLLAVIDYHERGEARPWGTDQAHHMAGMPNWCQHRGVYPMKLSKAWRFWQELDGKPIKQGDFASLLEDRITDILTPPDEDSPDQNDSKLLDLVRQLGGTLAGPSRMLELSRGLSVNETSRVTNVLNLTTGEKQIVYESSLQGSDGAPIKVPSMFLIGIPVFESGALYRIPVRLRFRKVGQDVCWTLLRHRPEIYFEDAFNDSVAAVREKCGLPVFIGEPER